ncbi:MAG: hypothetical protein FWE40_00285 [Oscillospiraceae bacterium]|nr:hypothetical protein [Oscillospiraceae bacterium]
MRKYFIAIVLVIAVVVGVFFVTFSTSFFIDLQPNAPITVEFYARGQDIMHQGEPLLLRGVEITPSAPGRLAGDFSIGTDDYLRWFGHIYAMGANTIYVSNVMDPAFYRALYRFNSADDDRQLLVLQGVHGDDYDSLTRELKRAIDIIHGRRAHLLGSRGAEFFLWDISPWVVGFLVGAEWEPDWIIYKNHFVPDMPQTFQGEFFSASEEANPFEVMLARVMDSATAYETTRYKTQRPIGFISSPITDFLEYYWTYASQLRKYAQLNAEHVIPTDAMTAGTFAAYRLFHFADDFVDFLTPNQQQALAPILENLDRSCLYYGYFDLLVQVHSMPVLATGFGFSSARAPQREGQVPLTEYQQGQALANMVTQLEERGWAGSIISTWQDNWERRTWNSAFMSNPWRYQYWHNLQSVAQGYGLMAFDPGATRRPVVIDGTTRGWDESHFVHTADDISIYAQYTTQGLYLLLRGEGVNPRKRLYLPIDVTPLSGTYAFNGMEFERPANFVLRLAGRNNTSLLVNRRYHSTYQRFYYEMTGRNPFVAVPPVWDSDFVPVTIAVQNPFIIAAEDFYYLADEVREMQRMQSWNTGRLTHGIGNPNSRRFNSLADFFFGEDLVEIRLPWSLLNFYDPSVMQVHDDHFAHFGVQGLGIGEIYIGIATQEGMAAMSPIVLRGWGNTVQTHERLKQSYFVMQELWGQ